MSLDTFLQLGMRYPRLTSLIEWAHSPGLRKVREAAAHHQVHVRFILSALTVRFPRHL